MPPRPTRTFALRTLAWLAYLLPLAYAGRIAAVFVHEALGHGLASLATAGRFDGLQIDFDGSGRAYVAGGNARTVVLAAGIAAQVLAGLACVLASMRLPAQPLVRAALLLLALDMFHDALPYGLWAAWLPTPEARADVARILYASGDPTVARATIAGFAAAYVSAVAVTSWLLLRVLERDLGPLTRGRAAILAGALAVAIAVGYFTFDWSSLVPGIGDVPAWSATPLQASVAIAFVARRRPSDAPSPIDRRSWRTALACTWIACVICIALVALWLRDGVRWS